MTNRTVTFMPISGAEKIVKPSNVISIGNPGTTYYYRVKHKRLLELRFESGEDFTEEQTALLFAFVKECEQADEPIIVHCQYGQCRSPAIAVFIKNHFDYELVGNAKSKNDTSLMDKFLYNLLGRSWLRSCNT